MMQIMVIVSELSKVAMADKVFQQIQIVEEKFINIFTIFNIIYCFLHIGKLLSIYKIV